MHAGPQGEKRSSLPDQCNTRLLNIERGKCVHTFIEYHKTLGNYSTFNRTVSIVTGLVKEKKRVGTHLYKLIKRLCYLDRGHNQCPIIPHVHFFSPQ